MGSSHAENLAMDRFQSQFLLLIWRSESFPQGDLEVGSTEPVTLGDNAVLDQDTTIVCFESHDHGLTRVIATSNSASVPNT
jgi:hypothetical protein